MQGKTVVITGGTSGIGLVAAQALAARGARIVMIARDAPRARAMIAALAAPAEGAHAVHVADLSVLGQMKRAAAQVAEAEPRIDVLVNNAGALFARRQYTSDGLEMTFAVNHMGYFVVTAGLMERLKATPGARVVSTASAAHLSAKLDFEDLQATGEYSGFGAYGRSKLANILFTRALARRLVGSGVTANCLHPGFVATRFGDASGGMVQVLTALAKRLFAITPEEGAKTIIHLASSPEVEGVSGQYFYRCKVTTPSIAAQDDASAERLWAVSEELAG